MITITIADVLDDTAPILIPYKLYLIRDSDVVFYVGKTGQYVIDRLLGHLGKGAWSWAEGPSYLGRLVLDNLPESRDWQVDLRTIAECEPLVKEVFPSLKNFTLSSSDPGLAERALIRHYCPCLNGSSLLPEKYRKGFFDDGETHRYME
jgi:hypothetical protein